MANLHLMILPKLGALIQDVLDLDGRSKAYLRAAVPMDPNSIFDTCGSKFRMESPV